MEIDPIGGEAKYAKVVHQFRAAIEGGSLQPGDRLPTEQELAAKFRVSRATIREALSALKVLGLVESKQGAGTCVTETPSPAHLLGERLRRMVNAGNPVQILEARAILEVSIASLAASRRTQRDLKAMRTALASIEQGIKRGDRDARAGADFHLAVAKATQNPLLVAMTEVGLERVHGELWGVMSELRRPIPRREYLVQHEALYSAIEKGDPHEARRAAEVHFASMMTYVAGNDQIPEQ